MNKIICSALLMLTFLLFSLPCFATDWLPPLYEMPRTVITPEVAKSSFSGLKNTLKAAGDTGLEIMAIIVSVTLIASIFSRTISMKWMPSISLKNRERHRMIRFLDRSRNMNSIVNDRVGAMEVQMFAKTRFRLRHPSADLNEKIYQRELSYLADLKMAERHPDIAIEKRKRITGGN